MKKSVKIKIVNKRRFTAFLTVCALICTAIFTAAFSNSSHVSASDAEYELIYVGDGDTLWSIAKDYYPSSMNVHNIISDIKFINDMTSNTIYSGDVLYIPVY